MNKIAIGFLGYGTRALDALMEDPLFEVRYFFAPKARLCQDVYDAHERYPEIPYRVVENNDDLEEAMRECGDVECFLMNACPIILKKPVLDLMPVYNIHPGDLRYNRGHQPHMWTVLLGEKESRIVLHKVTPGIDEGEVICSKRMEILPEYDAQIVLDGLEDMIPELLDGLYDYLKNGKEPEDNICGGVYRPIMTYEDYRIDFSDAENVNFIRDTNRKIRARILNHGAFFYWNKKMIYVDRLISFSDQSSEKISVHIDEDEVTVICSGGEFLFHVRQIIDRTEDSL